MSAKRANPAPVQDVPREKMRCFDGANKNYYDVVLNVNGEKFFVLKGHLAQHSDFFDRMFFGPFAEKDRQELPVGDVDPHYFQIFMELINGEMCLDDDNIEGVLQVVQRFLADSVLKRCENFLLKKSELREKKKFQLAVEYGFGELLKKTISEISSTVAFLLVVPLNCERLDKTMQEAILEKAKTFQSVPSVTEDDKDELREVRGPNDPFLAKSFKELQLLLERRIKRLEKILGQNTEEGLDDDDLDDIEWLKRRRLEAPEDADEDDLASSESDDFFDDNDDNDDIDDLSETTASNSQNLFA